MQHPETHTENKSIEELTNSCLINELDQELKDPEKFKKRLIDVMVKVEGKDPLYATAKDWFYALAYLLRGAMNQQFIETARQ